MRQMVVAFLACTTVASGITPAAAHAFASSNVRGRYTGNLSISETIPDGNGGSVLIDARQLLALTFDGRSSVSGITSVTAYVPGADANLFTCVFTATGEYAIGDEGLGTATLAITPTTACAGPATLKMSLLVGGRHHDRLDVTIDGANSVPPGDTPIPLVGSGVLSEQ